MERSDTASPVAWPWELGYRRQDGWTSLGSSAACSSSISKSSPLLFALTLPKSNDMDTDTWHSESHFTLTGKTLVVGGEFGEPVSQCPPLFDHGRSSVSLLPHSSG